MTAVWKIPAMADPLGCHWNQPKDLRDRVTLTWECAYIHEHDWKRLPTYDRSYPSGVYPGKVWRRNEYLCWYGPERDGRCAITHLLARVVTAGDLVATQVQSVTEELDWRYDWQISTLEI